MLTVGKIILIDGRAWNVTAVDAEKGKGTAQRKAFIETAAMEDGTSTERQRYDRISFGLQWVEDIGEGLFTLRGRLAAPTRTDVDAVAETAVVNVT